MRDLSTLSFHPTSEKITNILRKKTQNNNPHFFRILVSYYLAKMAASMRITIATKDRGMIPVNLYALSLAGSGHGKNFSTNIMEEQLLGAFRDTFFNDTLPIIADQALAQRAIDRAVSEGITEEEAIELLYKEYDTAGELCFSFDSGTTAAIKQMRHKLLLSNIGAMNLEIDEIGSNLLGNTEALNAYLELFDVGKIKQKLTKNTKENTRAKEIDGRTPANLMAFGTPDKLQDGGKVEEEFYSFLETGYGRRFFYGLSGDAEKKQQLTPEEVYNILTDPTISDDMAQLTASFGRLARPGNHSKILEVSKKVSILVIEYRLLCEQKAAAMNEFQRIAKAEMAHRYFKALKLAGAYAFIDEANEITEDNYYHAICMTEASGEAFSRIMTRDRSYVKLAKYLGSTPKEVTHVELQQDLPFYKGSMTAKQELIQLATAWGYKNHIVVKKSYTNGIEFFKGETLSPTNLDALQLAYSKEISDGYKNVQVKWPDLHKLTQQPDKHWISHHTENGHRSEESVLPGCDMIILDIDNTASVQEAVLLLEDYQYLLYTTKSYTADNQRFRIVMPLNYRIELNAEDFKIFMKNIYEWLPFEVDTQTGQRSRKWLTHKGKYRYNEGELLDARLFIPKTVKGEERAEFVATHQTLTNMERWFLQSSTTGNRNNQLLRYAYVMVDLGYDADSIKQSVLALNDKLPDSLPIAELNKTIFVSVHKRVAENDKP